MESVGVLRWVWRFSLVLGVIGVAGYALWSTDAVQERWAIWRLASQDGAVRYVAASTLEEIGTERAVIPLLDALRRQRASEWRQYAVCNAIEKIVRRHPDVLPHFRDAMNDSHPLVRMGGLYGVTSLPEGIKLYGPEIVERLADEHPVVRQVAAVAVGHYAICSRDSALLLGRILQDPECGFRAIAAESLADLGACALPALPALIGVLQEDGQDLNHVRLPAIVALGRIGREAWKALPELRVLLESEDESVRAAAQTAIVRIEAREPLPPAPGPQDGGE